MLLGGARALWASTVPALAVFLRVNPPLAIVLYVRLALALILFLTVAPITGATAEAQTENDEGVQPAWLEGALNDYWEDQFAAAGLDYEAPEVVLVAPHDRTGCGEMTEEALLSYCGGDTIYVNAAFDFDELVAERGTAYEIRWVLNIAGMWATWLHQQGHLSPGDTYAPEEAVFLERCLAGAFVGYAADEDLFAVADVEAALESLDEQGLLSDWDWLGYEEGLVGCDVEFARAERDRDDAGDRDQDNVDEGKHRHVVVGEGDR
jgi:hypothetical protein